MIMKKKGSILLFISIRFRNLSFIGYYNFFNGYNNYKTLFGRQLETSEDVKFKMKIRIHMFSLEKMSCDLPLQGSIFNIILWA